jgi:hypothetical protein
VRGCWACPPSIFHGAQGTNWLGLDTRPTSVLCMKREEGAPNNDNMPMPR